MPITAPKKNDLITAGIKSRKSTDPNAWDKNKTRFTSPLMFAPTQPPKIPIASA
jgi:hypothetical protein